MRNDTGLMICARKCPSGRFRLRDSFAVPSLVDQTDFESGFFGGAREGGSRATPVKKLPGKIYAGAIDKPRGQ